MIQQVDKLTTDEYRPLLGQVHEKNMIIALQIKRISEKHSICYFCNRWNIARCDSASRRYLLG